jgi:GntR family uxuAB operon transcriptional repressor
MWDSSTAPGRELAARILAEAERASLVAGSRLPTERAFAHDLQVTRTEVRHALALLESAGKISRAVGRGTFLRQSSVSAASSGGATGSPLADVSPADVMTARSLLEPHAMPLAVAYATRQDIQEMERCLLGADSADTYADFEAWDLALHRSIMAATHNPLVLRLYAAIEDARRGQLWGQLKLRSDSPERRDLYKCEHHAIVQALKERDSEQAVVAMTEHLASVAANLLGRIT